MLSQLVDSSVTVHALVYLTILSNCIIAQAVTCFLLQRPGFNTKVVEKVVLEKTVFWALRISPPSYQPTCSTKVMEKVVLGQIVFWALWFSSANYQTTIAPYSSVIRYRYNRLQKSGIQGHLTATTNWTIQILESETVGWPWVMKCEGCRTKRTRHNWSCYYNISLRRLRKATKYVSKNIQFPG